MLTPEILDHADFSWDANVASFVDCETTEDSLENISNQAFDFTMNDIDTDHTYCKKSVAHETSIMPPKSGFSDTNSDLIVESVQPNSLSFFQHQEAGMFGSYTATNHNTANKCLADTSLYTNRTSAALLPQLSLSASTMYHLKSQKLAGQVFPQQPATFTQYKVSDSSNVLAGICTDAVIQPSGGVVSLRKLNWGTEVQYTLVAQPNKAELKNQFIFAFVPVIISHTPPLNHPKQKPVNRLERRIYGKENVRHVAGSKKLRKPSRKTGGRSAKSNKGLITGSESQSGKLNPSQQSTKDVTDSIEANRTNEGQSSGDASTSSTIQVPTSSVTALKVKSATGIETASLTGKLVSPRPDQTPTKKHTKTTRAKHGPKKANPAKISEKDRKTESEPQKAITDFFDVRRTNRRQTSKQLKKARLKELTEKILDNCEDGLEVIDMGGKGRGVVALRPFEKDEFVVEYAGELVNITTAKQREMLYAQDEEIGCYMYYFVHNNKHYCIDATAESGKLGRLLNHSRKGNCYTKVVPVGERPYLVLLASRHIEKGEELTYDYGDRSRTAIVSHPWLKS